MIWTTILIVALAVAVLYYGIPLLWMVALRILLGRRAARRGEVVITFDDGPSDRLTPALLDLLREKGRKATFFLLGKNVAGHEDLVRRMALEGHEIGSHGCDHLDYWRSGPVRALRDIKRSWELIDRALNRSNGSYPFRPPYGRLSLPCLIYLWVHRVPIVYWTYDAGDTWLARQREARMACAPVEAGRGAVILLHDFDRVHRQVDDAVIACVKAFLERADGLGAPVVTVSEFLRSDKGKCSWTSPSSS
jgi:peptidoglycan/xylan/chitin deacetylase (PgdA/CDA1 family)